jgi:GH24 family phage-related lysozyme (muramidase)
MTGRLRTSAAGLQLIKSFEGFRETASQLPGGRWTIGHGHVRTAREGLTISEKDAEDLLILDLKPVEDAIATSVFAPLMQNQFDALVSFVFNISPAQFRESDILRNLNAGDFLAAANGFDLWRRARLNGRVMVVDALVRRRAAEKSLFLDHPSGRVAAPTPVVKPEMDVSEAVRTTYTQDADEDAAPRQTPQGGSMDIAEAVRRLAERTREAISPAPEIPLPQGAVVTPPETARQQVEPQPEPQPVQQAQPPQPKTPEDIQRAGRDIAERVRAILQRAEETIVAQPEIQQSVRTSPEAVEVPHHADNENERVREGMPDFDAPVERASRSEAARSRRLIDDTETFDPGRRPEDIFAEAERKAQIVNGQARRVGPVSGRLIIHAPWIVVLVLSLVGFAIGAVEVMRSTADGGAPQLAGVALAAFGVMLVMSVYFIFWNRDTQDHA